MHLPDAGNWKRGPGTVQQMENTRRLALTFTGRGFIGKGNKRGVGARTVSMQDAVVFPVPNAGLIHFHAVMLHLAITITALCVRALPTPAACLDELMEHVISLGPWGKIKRLCA